MIIQSGARPVRHHALHRSSKNTPCPACHRTKDSDCRWSADWISCHSGAAAHDLQPGQTIALGGQLWYLSRTGGGHSGVAHIYRPHKQQHHVSPRQRRAQAQETALTAAVCRHFYGQLRLRVHAVLRLPQWEHCSPDELKLVDATFHAAQQLIHQIQRGRCVDPSLQRLLPVARHWIKALGYQQADLHCFQRQHLGMQEGWQ